VYVTSMRAVHDGNTHMGLTPEQGLRGFPSGEFLKCSFV
jgi:hypothetical protein